MTAKVALTGWFGSDNLGDELILQALVEAVQARGGEPLAVSINADYTRRLHGIKSLVHRSVTHHRALVRQLRHADAMLVAGGIIQSETSPWNIAFHASRLRAAARAQCPVTTLGIGVGRVASRLNRSLARYALGPADALVVRDQASVNRLHGWGLHNAIAGADPVLGLKSPQVQPDDTVCIILRLPNHQGLKTAAAKSRARPDPALLDRLAQAVEAVVSTTGLVPRFVAFDCRRDHRLHQSVAERLSVEAEVTAPTLNNVLTEVGRSRLVITMRYHGAITALLHDRPAVLLNYSPKMASLAAEGSANGSWAPTVDVNRITAQQLVTAIPEAFKAQASGQVAAALVALRARLKHNNEALDAAISQTANPANKRQ